MIDKEQLFYQEIMQGLSADPKYLLSKYFYDKKGDELFQQIMHCSDYYLTRCELEILSEQASCIVQSVSKYMTNFDVVELGAGDATKSIYLLEEFLSQKKTCNYYPVDISANVISLLENKLPVKLPGINIKGWNGEYINMLEKISHYSDKKKLVLFLGGNIGNFLPSEAIAFLQRLHAHLNPGDLLLIGFDLKKHPRVILDAYNDSDGLTKAFNLNLLTRINRELGGEFEPANFDHYPVYDPSTGTCKSYLISLHEQNVGIGPDVSIPFKKNEIIRMEVSQKYSRDEIDQIAEDSGFTVVEKFYDRKEWFSDCLWMA